MRDIASSRDIAEALASTGYVSEDGMATIAYLAVTMGRPLLLEGEPGTGKTALAESLADGLKLPLIRLQCYEGIDASQALYDWDFTKQILHLRAVETASTLRQQHNGARSEPLNSDDIEESLFDERFLLARPVLRALREGPCVLLIDEIDRADDEFEAFLLEVLSTNQVSIPELGTIQAAHPPIVVMTSNRTRELHDALKRRCLYHWIDHPSLDREVAIVRRRLPGVPERLAAQLVTAVQHIRNGENLIKPPGIAESLDWAQALLQLGSTELDLPTAASTIGAVCKHREDLDRVRDSLDRLLAA